MTSESPAARLLAAVGNATELVGRAAGHIALLGGSARRDALAVARDSQALWALLWSKGLELYGAVRATPRLARVLGEALRLVAAHRVDSARREVLGLGRGDGRAAARRVREVCSELRGGVLKLGQIASSRVDLLPPAAVEELAHLQDRVPALPAEVIEAQVVAELGRPLGEVFARFGPAIAAASLAQVHEAELLDGTPVAVKVLVPGIADIVEADLAALRVIVAASGDILPGVDLSAVTTEVSRAVRAELDCVSEAAELRGFAERLAGRADVVVPRPIPELCTRGVLVMERIHGARLGDFLTAASPADRERVIVTLVDCFAEQILEHGAFHGDPHPGNFLVVEGEGGPRVALLDFGCVMHLPDEVRRAYAELTFAVLSGDAEGAARLFAELGFATRTGDVAALRELAGLMLETLRDGVDLANIDAGAQLARGMALLAAHPLVTVPHHFVLVGRVLASLGGLVLRYPPSGGLFMRVAPRLARARGAPRA